MRCNQERFTAAASNELWSVLAQSVYVRLLPLPLDPGREAFSEFFKGTGVLAFNLAPSAQIVSQVLQLLALLLKLQVQHLQLVYKLATDL